MRKLLLGLSLPVLLLLVFGFVDVRTTPQPKRAQLALSLVLDRSGSMAANGGWAALPPAADTFVSFFDDARDRMALVTFASHARVDVPLTQPFQAAIQNAIPHDQADYVGYTFFVGGLQLGFQQTESASPPPGGKLARVIVFFTDGLANTFQGTFDCPPDTILNLSSGDSGNLVNALDPATGFLQCGTSGAGEPLPCCPGLVTFPSIHGGVGTVVGPNAGHDVRLEAKDRAREMAHRIRETGTWIFTIGLGDNLDRVLLQEIANDPSSPTFDPTQPSGEFVQAPTAADLEDVFLRIARKILNCLST